MTNRTLNSLIIITIMIFHFNCSSQDKSAQEPCINREPYAAGRFYTSDPAELNANLEALFASAVPRKEGSVLAVVSPHAGYVFSGEVAASAFNQIDPGKKYENIFVLASSHVKYLNGASIYYKGNYVTPLGTVKIDRELAKKLVDEHDVFTFDAEADQYEHSLEVQLPFLQHIMQNEFTIIPIIIGTQSAKVCQDIASILKPYFNDKNLFVISTDFSHYPSYDDAVVADHATADGVMTNSPRKFLDALKNNEEKHYPNLVTSMCGWTSVLTLLYMTENDPAIRINPLLYRNSGDVSYGDKDRVVGYYALAVTKEAAAENPGTDFQFSEQDQKDLLNIARSTVETYVTKHTLPDIDTEKLSDGVKMDCGAFVTLHKDGKLRGCIGRFEATEPLYSIVQQMAVASSTQDSRFSPVTPEELDELEIEISVLSPMKKISSIDEIVLGKHGIYIKKGWSSGTFLPQVATETGWTKEEFLGHCARDKAGLGWEGWKNADIYIYEAFVFSEASGKK